MTEPDPREDLSGQDVARKLMSQDIGTLTKDIQDLRKAGAFMDNTRVRGMVGFVSNSISNDVADRAVGGGFVVGRVGVGLETLKPIFLFMAQFGECLLAVALVPAQEIEAYADGHPHKPMFEGSIAAEG